MSDRPSFEVLSFFQKLPILPALLVASDSFRSTGCFFAVRSWSLGPRASCSSFNLGYNFFFSVSGTSCFVLRSANYYKLSLVLASILRSWATSGGTRVLELGLFTIMPLSPRPNLKYSSCVWRILVTASALRISGGPSICLIPCVITFKFWGFFDLYALFTAPSSSASTL